MRKLLVSCLVFAGLTIAPHALAAPPDHCETGDLPDPCKPIYILCVQAEERTKGIVSCD
jgi:hypothetical protein